MTEPRTSRKVIITYRVRDPEDRVGYVHEVKEALQPTVVVACIETLDQPALDLTPAVANEQLETEARERAAEVLDATEREIRERKSVEAEPQEEAPSIEIDTATSKPMTEWLKKREAAEHWITELVAAGWRILLKVIEKALA